jgi:HEPN domain-containing protein
MDNDYDKIEYWNEMSAYDFDTAKAMLNTGRYLYVGFMCHQAVEKALKGKFVEAKPEGDLPYIHNLVRIAEFAEIFDAMPQDYKKFLVNMMPMNIEARYPRKKDEVFKSLTKERCEEIIKDTEDFLKWVNES